METGTHKKVLSNGTHPFGSPPTVTRRKSERQWREQDGGPEGSRWHYFLELACVGSP